MRPRAGITITGAPPPALCRQLLSVEQNPETHTHAGQQEGQAALDLPGLRQRLRRSLSQTWGNSTARPEASSCPASSTVACSTAIAPGMWPTRVASPSANNIKPTSNPAQK